MRKKFNLKIVGSGPTGLLLSIALSKLNINIFLTDLLTREKLTNKDKTYAITHSTKKILIKFGVWHKLKSFLNGFDTLSISDSFTSEFVILSILDLDKDLSSEDNIGWVIKHSDLMNVFFEEIDTRDNIFFKSVNSLAKLKVSFDYEFISTGANSIDKRFYKFWGIKQSYNQSCLTFKVLIRGNVKNRAYEIFRKEGPLALLPLDNDLYQIIWTSSTSKALDRLNSDKNFLLDNLSVILPENFKLDQIVGELNVFPISLSFNLPIYSFRKFLFVGDSFHTFHPVGGQGLNTCWRDVNSIFDILNECLLKDKIDFDSLKFKYFFNRFIDIFVTIIITDLLIKFFANNNLLLFPLRKISFFLLNKFHFIRKLVLNQMTKSLVFLSIK